MQALARFDLGQHGHVGVLGQQRRQGFLGIAQAQVDRDAGVAHAQLGQHRHDLVWPVGGNFQAPGKQLAVGFEHHLRLLGQAEHRAGDGGQAGALLGQLHTPRSAPQQGDLVMLLECLDVPGDRWLADEQARSSASKAALAGHRIESAKLEQVHIYRPDLWLA